jgi:hypothetical protein
VNLDVKELANVSSLTLTQRRTQPNVRDEASSNVVFTNGKATLTIPQGSLAVLSNLNTDETSVPVAIRHEKSQIQWGVIGRALVEANQIMIHYGVESYNLQGKKVGN